MQARHHLLLLRLLLLSHDFAPSPCYAIPDTSNGRAGSHEPHCARRRLSLSAPPPLPNDRFLPRRRSNEAWIVMHRSVDPSPTSPQLPAVCLMITNSVTERPRHPSSPHCAGYPCPCSLGLVPIRPLRHGLISGSFSSFRPLQPESRPVNQKQTAVESGRHPASRVTRLLYVPPQLRW